uniref:Uncharacterized protein n=1 Tax=Aegilops tauschii subsp. strangulata TaxID=200361 RepID=A0A453RXW7_AEGTS
MFSCKTEDAFSWKLTSNGVYLSKAAYDAQFIGRIRQSELSRAWRKRVEGKIKFFI